MQLSYSPNSLSMVPWTIQSATEMSCFPTHILTSVIYNGNLVVFMCLYREHV